MDKRNRMSGFGRPVIPGQPGKGARVTMLGGRRLLQRPKRRETGIEP